MRRYRVTPTAWDIAYAARQRVIQQNLDAWEAEQAAREWAEWRENRDRWGSQPRHPVRPSFGYAAAARRLGVEDQYENDLRQRYGDDA